MPLLYHKTVYHVLALPVYYVTTLYTSSTVRKCCSCDFATADDQTPHSGTVGLNASPVAERPYIVHLNDKSKFEILLKSKKRKNLGRFFLFYCKDQKSFLEQHIVLFDPAELPHNFTEYKREDRGENDTDKYKTDPHHRA